MIKKFLQYLSAVICAAVFCTTASAQLKVGTYAVNQYMLGEYAEYACCSAGGSMDIEYGIPLPFLQNFGVSGRAQAAAVIPAAGSNMQPSWNTAAMAGIWVNFPLPDNFSVQPETDWGIWINALDEKLYVDQVIQLSCAVRYSPEKIADARLTFEIAPVYSFMPEQDCILNTIGIRPGVLYRLKEKK